MEKLRLICDKKPEVELGILSYDGARYSFAYSDARSHYNYHRRFFEVPGIPMMPPGETIYSNTLFDFFKDRIPPRNREDFPKSLERLGLKKYDEWEYLKAGGLRLLTDSYRLVDESYKLNDDSIIELENETVEEQSL